MPRGPPPGPPLRGGRAAQIIQGRAGRRSGQASPLLLLAALRFRTAGRRETRAGGRFWLANGSRETVLVQIFVRDNNVDQALKALKKKMQREGTFREMKRRNHYEKPSEKRARERAEAVRRARKLARKRAQREGLLPRPPSKR